MLHIKVCGLWVSTASGNTFSPAIQLTDGWTGKMLIIRFDHKETMIFSQKDGAIGWNSDHIARCLGKYHESPEDSGNPSYYRYDGWLGEHIWL